MRPTSLKFQIAMLLRISIALKSWRSLDLTFRQSSTTLLFIKNRQLNASVKCTFFFGTVVVQWFMQTFSSYRNSGSIHASSDQVSFHCFCTIPRQCKIEFFRLNVISVANQVYS